MAPPDPVTAMDRAGAGAPTTVRLSPGTAPKIKASVQLVDSGARKVLTLDGSIHLALTAAEAAVLPTLDGTSSAAEISASQPAVDVIDLLQDLDSVGFLEGAEVPDESGLVVTRSGIEVGGFDKIVGVLHRSGARHLINPATAVVALGGAVAGTALALRHTGASGQSGGPAALLFLLALGWLATAAHETAHALVIHHHGRRVGRAGMGFYWGALCFYVDATDALFLARRQRIAQSAAGPLADLAVIGACGLAIPVTPDKVSPVLAAFVVLTWIDVAVNVSPFLKLDGYWLLADLTGRPTLAEDAQAALTGRSSAPAPIRRRLALYGAASYAFGMVLLATSAWAWITHLGPFVADSWRHGPTGKAMAIVFTAPLAISTLAAITDAVRQDLPNAKGGEPT